MPVLEARQLREPAARAGDAQRAAADAQEAAAYWKGQAEELAARPWWKKLCS
jgi:hypothetical protein